MGSPFGDNEHYMLARVVDVGQTARAQGALAARSSEGRWPRICELRHVTGATRVGCVHEH